MDAAEVIYALRRRYPACEPGIAGPGRWTTLREWNSIDLLALDSWADGNVVAFEVKVSRSDMRHELLRPHKRLKAVQMSTQFYLAIPAGMMTPDERAYEEPVWAPEDFERASCTNPNCSLRLSYQRGGRSSRYACKPRGARLRGTDGEGVSVDLGDCVETGSDVRHDAAGEPYTSTYTRTHTIEACCASCRGYGSVGRSRVEEEAPTLWVPRDCGLVVVGPGGSSAVLKPAPRRKLTTPIVPWPVDRGVPEDQRGIGRSQRQVINQLVRWSSYRPDPRHAR